MLLLSSITIDRDKGPGHTWREDTGAQTLMTVGASPAFARTDHDQHMRPKNVIGSVKTSIAEKTKMTRGICVTIRRSTPDDDMERTRGQFSGISLHDDLG